MSNATGSCNYNFMIYTRPEDPIGVIAFILFIISYVISGIMGSVSSIKYMLDTECEDMSDEFHVVYMLLVFVSMFSLLFAVCG